MTLPRMALVFLIGVGGTVAVSLATGYRQASLNLTIVSCAVDANETPIVTWSKSYKYWTPPIGGAFSGVRRIETRAYVVTLRVPVGNGYVRVKTSHCGAQAETNSLDGEHRDLIVATSRGYAGSFDVHQGSLAGHLPVLGFDTVAIYHGSPATEQLGQIVGHYFYFNNVLTNPEPYTLRITFANDIAIEFPVTISASSPNAVVSISLKDILAARQL